MIACELCIHSRPEGKCDLDLKIPKGMSCREFCPGIQKFFANPQDFVDVGQVIEMATYFGTRGTELKKIKEMAARAASARS